MKILSSRFHQGLLGEQARWAPLFLNPLTASIRSSLLKQLPGLLLLLGLLLLSSQSSGISASYTKAALLKESPFCRCMKSSEEHSKKTLCSCSSFVSHTDVLLNVNSSTLMNENLAVFLRT